MKLHGSGVTPNYATTHAQRVPTPSVQPDGFGGEGRDDAVASRPSSLPLPPCLASPPLSPTSFHYEIDHAIPDGLKAWNRTSNWTARSGAKLVPADRNFV